VAERLRPRAQPISTVTASPVVATGASSDEAVPPPLASDMQIDEQVGPVAVVSERARGTHCEVWGKHIALWMQNFKSVNGIMEKFLDTYPKSEDRETLKKRLVTVFPKTARSGVSYASFSEFSQTKTSGQLHSSMLAFHPKAWVETYLSHLTQSETVQKPRNQ
jgi:hypothetical protein